jgi:Family of unknown function (DUF6521)
MIPWMSRPAEERALLNPSFCSCLLWQASAGYEDAANAPLPFDVAFLVLPMVLHRDTRESLPKLVKTSLAVWLGDNPLSRSRVADRARTLSPFTKDAMMFGGVHGLFDLKGGAITPNGDWEKRIAADLKDSTDEVRTCSKRAEFVGRWFARAGSPRTVLAILGVRP